MTPAAIAHRVYLHGSEAARDLRLAEAAAKLTLYSLRELARLTGSERAEAALKSAEDGCQLLLAARENVAALIAEGK